MWYIAGRLALDVCLAANGSKADYEEPGGGPHGAGGVMGWFLCGSRCAMKKGELLSGSEKAA